MARCSFRQPDVFRFINSVGISVAIHIPFVDNGLTGSMLSAVRLSLVNLGKPAQLIDLSLLEISLLDR